MLDVNLIISHIYLLFLLWTAQKPEALALPLTQLHGSTVSELFFFVLQHHQQQQRGENMKRARECVLM